LLGDSLRAPETRKIRGCSSHATAAPKRVQRTRHPSERRRPHHDGRGAHRAACVPAGHRNPLMSRTKSLLVRRRCALLSDAGKVRDSAELVARKVGLITSAVRCVGGCQRRIPPFRFARNSEVRRAPSPVPGLPIVESAFSCVETLSFYRVDCPAACDSSTVTPPPSVFVDAAASRSRSRFRRAPSRRQRQLR